METSMNEVYFSCKHGEFIIDTKHWKRDLKNGWTEYECIQCKQKKFLKPFSELRRRRRKGK